MVQRLAMSEDQAGKDDQTGPGTGQAQNHFDVVTDMIALFAMIAFSMSPCSAGQEQGLGYGVFDTACGIPAQA